MKCRQKDVEALFQRVSNASAAVRATDLENTPPATSKNVATNRLQRCTGGVTKSRRLPRADAEAASVHRRRGRWMRTSPIAKETDVGRGERPPRSPLTSAVQERAQFVDWSTGSLDCMRDQIRLATPPARQVAARSHAPPSDIRFAGRVVESWGTAEDAGLLAPKGQSCQSPSRLV